MKTAHIFAAALFALVLWGSNLHAQDLYVVGNLGTVGEYSVTTGSAINANLVTGLGDAFTGGGVPGGITVSGNTLYVTITSGTVGEYNAITGVAISGSLIVAIPQVGTVTHGLNDPIGVAVSDGDLFVANHGGVTSFSYVSEYSASSGALLNGTFTNYGLPTSLAVSGGILYGVDTNNTTNSAVFAVNASTGADIPSFSLELDAINDIAVSGNTIYVSTANHNIGAYNATTGAVINANLITGIENPQGLAVYGNDLFVVKAASNTIAEYNATTGALIDGTFITGLKGPTDITISMPATSSSTYWTGATNANWSGANWNTDADSNMAATIPASTSNVFFATTNPVAGNLNTILDTSFSINSLNFLASSPSVTIGNGGTLANTLTIGTGGINVEDASAASTISANVTLGASQTWTIGADSGSSSAGVFTVSGIVGDDGNGYTLTKNGTGTLTFTGTNTYTGGTIVNAGIVNYDNTQANGNFTMNGGAASGVLGGITQFINDATAGTGTFNNNGGAVAGAFGGSTQFKNSSADNGIFLNNGATVAGGFGGSTKFFLDSTAENGVFNNYAGVDNVSYGLTQFNDESSAGTVNNSSSFINYGAAISGASGGQTQFNDESTAGTGTFTNMGGTTLSGALGGATAFNDSSNAGSAAIFTNNAGAVNGALGGVTMFNDESTAGTGATFINNASTFSGSANTANAGSTVFNGTSNAGFFANVINMGAAVGGANGGLAQFNDQSNSGSGTFNNLGGTVDGANGGSTVFNNASNAGSGAFNDNSGTVSGANGGSTIFNNNSGAGTATFNNQGNMGSGAVGSTIFNDQSDAASGTFNNLGGTVNGANGGTTMFNDQSNAYKGTFNNLGGAFNGANGGSTVFSGSSFAFQASFNNYAGTANGANGGSTTFNGASIFNGGSAFNAFVVTNYGAQVSGANGGVTTFNDSSSVSPGTFVVFINDPGLSESINAASNGGSTVFNGTSNAGSSEYANESYSGSPSVTNGNANGGSTIFNDSASAGSGFFYNFGGTTPTNRGSTVFNGNSTAGNATLVANPSASTEVLNGNGASGAGGLILFSGNSTGGTATVEVNNNGILDISPHNSAGVTIGSLEGNGNVFLGGNNLTVGNNNAEEIVFSGTIQDGGSAGGTGGSLTKSGSDTLNLSGTNIYTGATTVSGGVLDIRSSISPSSAVSVAPGAALDLVPQSVITFSNNVANSGTVGVSPNNVNITLSGTISGTGGLDLEGSGSVTIFITGANSYSGNTSIGAGGGAGVVNIQNNTALGNGAGVTTVSSNNTLQLQGNITVGGEALILNGSGRYGQIGALVNISGFNSYGGVITIASDSTISALPGSVLTLTGSVNKNGTTVTFNGGGTINAVDPISGEEPHSDLVADGAGTDLVLSAINTYNGPTTVENGATLALTGSGSIDTSTAINIDSATFDVSGRTGGGYTYAGPLIGSGTIVGNYTNTGTVVAGLPGSVPAGDLAVQGNYTQTTGGMLKIGLTGGNAGQYNVLQVTGNASVAGTLDLDFLNGFAPSAGEVFNFLTSSSLTGQFDSVDVTGLLAGWQYTLVPLNGTLSLVSTNDAISMYFLVPSGANTVVTNNSGVATGLTILFEGGTLEAAGNLSLDNPVLLNSNATFQGDAGTISTLGGVISGSMNFLKTGAGTLSLEGLNTYTGSTTVGDGKLYIDGSVAGDVAVLSPGFLGGHGLIGGNLSNGGVVSPGNSPGTLTVAGNFTQPSAGTLLIEIGGVAAGQHDLLAVGGTASLNGTLELVRLNNFQPKAGEDVVFLTAGGGVSGKFTNVDTGTIPGVKVVYQPDDVMLDFVQNSFEQLPGLTPNELAVARSLDAAANDPRNTALNNFLNGQPLANLPGDFALVSPEQLTSLFQTSVSFADVQAANIESHLAAVRAGNTPPPPGATTGLLVDGKDSVGRPGAGDGKNVPAPAPSGSRWNVWMEGDGDFVRINGDTNAAGYHFATGGVTLGGDYRVCDHFVVGLMGGYADTGATLTQGGAVDVNSGRLGIYSTAYDDSFYLNTLASGGYNSYDTHRTALGGIAQGNTDGAEFDGLMGGGYDIHQGDLTLGPIVSVQYTNVAINQFNENGSLAPLNILSQSQDSLRTKAGFKLVYDLKTQNGLVVTPSLTAAWQHEYLESAFALDSQFASGAGNVFTVNGPKLGRDSAVVNAGVNVQWTPRIGTYINYYGELGRTDYELNSVTGGVKLSF